MKHLALALLLAAAPAAAHELKTATIWLDESAPGRVAVTLRIPLAIDGGAATLVPRFEPACRDAGASRSAREDDAVRTRYALDCGRPLATLGLRLEGLDPRMPEAIVIARYAGGGETTFAIDRHAPEVALGAAPSAPRALASYFPLGVEHILTGADHLLFVLGLMLAVLAGGGSWRRLLLAITAFTLAHSLTLALAALGVWGLPPQAVELLIALSIVTLALELARHPSRVDAGLPPTLALRQPAVAAFAFGLLHGFGFAGALREAGLPDAARAWALALFNLGVEAGQLLFVGAVLGLAALARRAGRRTLPAPAALATALGGIATYWTLERLLDWTAHLTGRI